MKKLIITLIALSLLLTCLSALAEGTPLVFEETGINIDFQDVLDASPFYADLWEIGIIGRDPFVSTVNLEYYALPKEFVRGMVENYDSFSDELKDDVRTIVTGTCADLADVVVTDIQDTDTLIKTLWGGKLPEGAEIDQFGEVGSYRYYVVTKPGFEEPEDYEVYREYDMDPEEIREAYEVLSADMDGVRAALLERLKTAELYAPVDPEANLPGQILSFETTDLDGNAVSSAELFKDNKITMVNIWGTWCHNCVDEMEELAQIHTRLRAKGCGIVGLEREQKPIDTMVDEIRAFLKEKGVDYPNVVMPADNAILDGITGYPTTFFVDSEGTILSIPISGAKVEAYESTVDQLLAGEAVDTVADAGAVKNDIGEYRVIVYDLEGNPVEGALIQLCDEATCAFQPTDVQGVATFSVGEEKAYDVHVLMAPEGYAPDQGEYKTLDTFCDVNIFLEKGA